VAGANDDIVGRQSVELLLRDFCGVLNWRSALGTRVWLADQCTAVLPISPTRVALYAVATRQGDNSTFVLVAPNAFLPLVVPIVGYVLTVTNELFVLSLGPAAHPVQGCGEPVRDSTSDSSRRRQWDVGLLRQRDVSPLGPEVPLPILLSN
jgi:hypothetical protein